jgi:hypothetical protein
MQFYIRGIRDVFLLNGRGDKCCFISFDRWFIIIDTNAFMKNKLNAFFTAAMPEMDRFIIGRKYMFPTEVLAADVPAPMFNDRFVL